MLIVWLQEEGRLRPAERKRVVGVRKSRPMSGGPTLGTKGIRRRKAIMDWEDRLDDWELELELGARLEGSDWVTLEKAAADTGVSRAALRTWYRNGQIPSRLVDGPHGPQRLVPLAMVAERAEASPRVRKTAERRLADEAQLELLRHRVDQLELRLADLERRLSNPQKD
jgi:transposase